MRYPLPTTRKALQDSVASGNTIISTFIVGTTTTPRHVGLPVWHFSNWEPPGVAEFNNYIERQEGEREGNAKFMFIHLAERGYPSTTIPLHFEVKKTRSQPLFNDNADPSCHIIRCVFSYHVGNRVISPEHPHPHENIIIISSGFPHRKSRTIKVHVRILAGR